MTLDVLIPTYRRPTALAVTLGSLAAQTFRDFRVVVSDQSDDCDPLATGEVQAILRILRLHRHEVETHRHLPRRGIAEQRQFLLDQARAPYALFIDDDLYLEPYVLGSMLTTIRRESCGFVGSAVLGLSYLNDVRPHQQAIEFWEGRVEPEAVRPGTSAWDRHKLHSAANLYHVQTQLGLSSDQPRTYKVAWVGACVLYDVAKLRSVGGFSFWSQLPTDHCGEDVLAQQRVMARYGGCGIIPSGVYHLELPTTLVDRSVNAPCVLDVNGMSEAAGAAQCLQRS